MNETMKTGLNAAEGVGAYYAVSYMPKTMLLKKWNGAAAGAIVLAAGYFSPASIKSHAISVGVGALVGGVLDAFGMRR